MSRIYAVSGREFTLNDMRIAKGDKGEHGDKGDKGDKGDRGETGDKWGDELITLVDNATNAANSAAYNANTTNTIAIGLVDNLTNQTIDFVNDAINSTAVEGGVLADTFVTTTANGVGSIARTQRDKNSDTVSVKDFGAKGDGVTDDTIALQAAADYITTGSAKTLHFPVGSYLITSTINFKAGHLQLRGGGMYNTDIVVPTDFVGSIFNFGGGYTYIDNIMLRGLVTAPRLFMAGTKGITGTSNLHLSNVAIRGIAKQITWGGGYYHRYYNCQFIYADVILDNVYANNFILHGCYSGYFNKLANIVSGQNFVYQSGSIEAWTGIAIANTAGSRATLSIKDTYVESMPVERTVDGSGLAPFGEAMLAYTAIGSVVLEDNAIQPTGMRRGVYVSSAQDAAYDDMTGAATYTKNKVNVRGRGNTWYLSKHGAAHDDIAYFYLVSGGFAESVDIQDTVSRLLDYKSTNAATSQKFFSYPSNRVKFVAGHDALTGKPFRVTVEDTGWVDLEMLNGWQSSALYNYLPKLSYRVMDNVLYLRGGVIGGTAATATNLAALPASVVARLYAAPHKIILSAFSLGVTPVVHKNFSIYENGSIIVLGADYASDSNSYFFNGLAIPLNGS